MVMMDTDGRLFYEQPFTPYSEWKQEEGCAVLVIHSLPGFSKERIRVQVQNSDRLRVYGEHLVNLTTQSFDGTYTIPKDCSTSDMQTMFSDGSFYVMLQKKNNIKPVGFKTNPSEPTQQTPKPIEEQVKDSTQQPIHEAPPPASIAGGGDRKPVEAPAGGSQIDELEKDRRQSISTKSWEAVLTSKLKSGEDGETINNIGKALSDIKAKAEEVSEGRQEDDTVEKDEEERKLLVIIGVAKLVIPVLGAYVIYSTWFSTGH